MSENNKNNDHSIKINEWDTLTDKIGIIYLVISMINLAYSFIISLYYVRNSTWYIFAAAALVGLIIWNIYWFIKKNNKIRVLTILSIFITFFWITMCMDLFPRMTISIIMSFIEVCFIVTNYYISRYLERS